jgi:uncharacterized protein
MKLLLTLDYTLGEGFLAPYLDGLREGHAVAARCPSCGRISLPPDPTCPCGTRSTQTLPLPGTATLLWRTTGTDGDVALVRFDGADTLSLARLHGFTTQSRGRLLGSPDAALVLEPEPLP